MKAEHPLDNIVWKSLTTNHKHLGIIGENAAIYHSEVSMFAGVKKDTDKAYYLGKD